LRELEEEEEVEAEEDAAAVEEAPPDDEAELAEAGPARAAVDAASASASRICRRCAIRLGRNLRLICAEVGAKGDGAWRGAAAVVDGIAAADEKFSVARTIIGEALLLLLMPAPLPQQQQQLLLFILMLRSAREEKAASVRLSAARAATRRGEIMFFFLRFEASFVRLCLIYKKIRPLLLNPSSTSSISGSLCGTLSPPQAGCARSSSAL